jgi:hypothetical protein
MFLDTPLRSCATSPPCMPPTMRRPNVISPSKARRRPQIAIRRGKKRCKQHPQVGMTMTDHDDGKAGGFGRGCITAAMCNDKHQARPPTDHLKRLLEEACPNHAYSIRDKLKNKSFMISGSLTRGTELEEDPGGSDTMPFPREDAIMTVYGGRPPPRRCHMSTLCPRASTHCGWGHGDRGVKAHVSQYPYKYMCVCVCVNMYITTTLRDKRKEQTMMGQIAQGQWHGSRPELRPIDWRRRPALLEGAPEEDQLPSRPPELTSRAGDILYR